MTRCPKIAATKCLVSLSSLLLLVGCVRAPHPPPPLSLVPDAWSIKRLPSGFPALNPQEGAWAQEVIIGRAFAREADFYRALTAFKRALILLPADQTDRRLEVQYDIVLSYCLAQRWQDALMAYRSSELSQAPPTFPAHRDLLLLVQEILLQTGDPEGAARIDRGLSDQDRSDSQIARVLQNREWEQVELPEFQQPFTTHRKSPERAAFYQAIFPGAGYWYVGQTRAGITSLMLNALTTAATVALACHHQWAAVALVGSVELGWYMGGINGAALAAHQWNRQLGEQLATPLLTQRKAALFRLEYAF